MTTTTLRPFLIGDQWIGRSSTAIDSVNPATGARNFQVAAADDDHVDAAVAAATRALPAWRALLPHQRANVLHAIAARLLDEADALARLQMVENGKIWSECITQAKSASATFCYYAAVAETMESEVAVPRGKYLAMTVHEPYGVVAAITPWNSPLTQAAQKVAPALAAGNTIVLKPSEVTPTTALELGRIALDAGLPPGALNVLPGFGATTGVSLVRHPGVSMTTFTGGTANGKAIASVAAGRMMPIALELGGKSPHIVFGDADLDAAAAGVAGGIFKGSGQSCVAGSRLFVQRSIYQAFLEKVVAKAKALRVGMPEESQVQMGPIASFAHRERIEAMVESARKEGGKVLAGGQRPRDKQLASGAFYLPTVIDGLDNRAGLARHEVFGPVLCALAFDSEEDLIAQANDSVYGLAAGIWTSDYRRAWRVARAVEAGSVWVNTYQQSSISAPFGGFKESGLGREKGLAGFRLYQQAKSIYFAMN